MRSLQELRQKGFTIVELLIVIVVIGILAALVITTFSGIQERARNTERETDIKAIHGQIEAYYAQKGYYPSLSQINNVAPDTTFRADNLKGLDDGAFTPPNSDETTLAAAATATQYGYLTEPADCDNAAPATYCASYTLTAVREGDDGNYDKDSLN